MVTDLTAYRLRKVANERRREVARWIYGTDDPRAMEAVGKLIEGVRRDDVAERLTKATGLDWR